MASGNVLGPDGEGRDDLMDDADKRAEAAERALELRVAIDEMEDDLSDARDELWTIIQWNALCPCNQNRTDCCHFPYDCEKL